MEASFYP
jgi:hypothetical protein